MNIGQLDQFLTLRRPTNTQNAAGRTTQTFADAAQVWARVEQKSAVEQARNAATNTVAAYAVRIRWRDDVRESWQVVWQGRTLSIAGVVQVGRRDALDLVCTEVRA